MSEAASDTHGADHNAQGAPSLLQSCHPYMLYKSWPTEPIKLGIPWVICCSKLAPSLPLPSPSLPAPHKHNNKVKYIE